ncbi:MAG: HD domain-containing protein [Nitrospiraceae bacterium]|nr:HD domain-containing protein [Nitrospiraceae bacterium]
MTEKDFTRLKRRFLRYVESYRMDTPGDQQNIALKRDHTLKVCRDIGLITRGEAIGRRNDALLARTAALLHDIGRFPQYAKFKTFNDGSSVNHGRLGAELLMKTDLKLKFLEGLSRGEQSLIIRAVKYHSALTLPRLDKRSAFLLRLVRDADKLDIWRVFVEYFGQEKKDRSTAAGQGLPEGEGIISPGVLRNIFENRLISLAGIRNLNDYKLLLLSWVYDINFRTTFRLFRKRRYLERLAAYLPVGEEADKAVAHLKEFVAQKAKN